MVEEMRRLILRSLLVIVCLGVLLLSWILAGRQLTLLLDRFSTVEMGRIPVSQIGYDGPDKGGLLRFENGMLGTNGIDHRPFPMTVGPGGKNQLVLAASGKSFPLGNLLAPPPPDFGAFAVHPEPGDEVWLITRRSFLSWPTPFDFNFMTGHAPSWKRHYYHQLSWKKRSGAALEMRWRYEQYFYPADGWTEGNMTHEGTTGLVRVEIKP